MKWETIRHFWYISNICLCFDISKIWKLKISYPNFSFSQKIILVKSQNLEVFESTIVAFLLSRKLIFTHNTLIKKNPVCTLLCLIKHQLGKIFIRYEFFGCWLNYLYLCMHIDQHHTDRAFFLYVLFCVWLNYLLFACIFTNITSIGLYYCMYYFVSG